MQQPMLHKTRGWNHQLAAFHFALSKNAAMLACEMGTGKTKIAIDLLCNWHCHTALILAPLKVLNVWPREFLQHSATRFQVVVLTRGSAKQKAQQAEQAVKLAKARGEPLAVIVNYETAIRTEFAIWALSRLWDCVICDECLPAGVLIDTPYGGVEIERLRPGDIVLGVDHRTGRMIQTRVIRQISRMSKIPVVAVNGVRMTLHHPVWTNRGYVPAFQLLDIDTVATIAPKYRNGNHIHEVRMVRADLSAKAQKTQILQPLVLGPLANVPTEFRAITLHAKEPRSFAEEYVETSQKPRGGAEITEILVIESQSISRSNSYCQGSRQKSRGGMEVFEWRKRNDSSASAADSFCCVGLALRSCSFDQEEQGITNALQDRRCEFSSQDWHRAGWEKPFSEEGQSSGCQKDGIFRIEWLDCDSIHECTDFQITAFCSQNDLNCDQSTEVFNLETQTGNFIAGGLLVHNSHRAKGHATTTGKLIGKLAGCSKHRLCLTGTPMPHSPLDIFSQYRFLDSRIFGRSFHKFRSLYARVNPMFPSKVDEWLNQEDLQQRFASIAFRVDNSVLDLPPCTEQDLTFELSIEAKRVYAELEEHLISDIATGVVTAANALVRLLRLQQATSGYAVDDETKAVAEIDAGKEELLAELLIDLPQNEPVVVFCRFRHDLDRIAAVATKLDRRYGEISGRRNDLTAEAKYPPAVDLLGVQIQSGGVGIDLTRARYAVYYSAGFSLGDFLQSQARLHRPGQTRPVHYYHLIAESTIDRAIYGALQKRQDLVEGVLSILKHRTEAEHVGSGVIG